MLEGLVVADFDVHDAVLDHDANLCAALAIVLALFPDRFVCKRGVGAAH